MGFHMPVIFIGTFPNFLVESFFLSKQSPCWLLKVMIPYLTDLSRFKSPWLYVSFRLVIYYLYGMVDKSKISELMPFALPCYSLNPIGKHSLFVIHSCYHMYYNYRISGRKTTHLQWSSSSPLKVVCSGYLLKDRMHSRVESLLHLYPAL